MAANRPVKLMQANDLLPHAHDLVRFTRVIDGSRNLLTIHPSTWFFGPDFVTRKLGMTGFIQDSMQIS